MTNDGTDQVRKDWDSQASSWYKQRESLLAASRPIHDWLVGHLEPRDGQRVLEIAAGPGDTGFLAARLLGNGHLLSTDLAPSMVENARKRGAELGVENADYRILDAQAMDLGDASFDGVICRWGFMLMPDPAAAFRECRRVLVPGGRLVFAVFTGPDENPFASIPARTLADAGHLPHPTSGWRPGILALADRTRLQALPDGAGFTSTQIEGVNMTWTFANGDEYWTFLVELTALGPLVRSLPDSARDAVRAEINQRLMPFTRANGIALPSRCWGGVAVR
jgi:ubiquinone/menaquinone biosynthesis C-methylase UbiE